MLLNLDNLYEISLNVDRQTLNSLLRTDRNILKKIDSDIFWESRLKKQYGCNVVKSEFVSWKRYYIETSSYGIAKAYGKKITKELNKFERISDIYLNYNIIILINDGSCFSYDGNRNRNAGLGDHEHINSNSFLQLPVIPDRSALSISSSGYHTVVLTRDGKCYMFGMNNRGQLGLGDNETRCYPVLLENFNNVVQVSCGASHTGILTKNGKCYMFGHNDVFQLGTGEDNENKNTPILLKNIEKIIKISCGSNHTAILTKNGKCYAFGYNNCGQLGIHIDITYLNIPKQIGNFNNVVDICCGGDNTVFIRSSNVCYFVGNNRGITAKKEFNSFHPSRIGIQNVSQVFCSLDGIILVTRDNSIIVRGRRIEWTSRKICLHKRVIHAAFINHISFLVLYERNI